MTTYYLNPYTGTNGTGTFASPYSASSASRTAWASGDELRILGNTVPLFLPTTYTASHTSDTTMTITSGGALGADWVAGNYGYIVEDDTFFYVGSVTSNTLTCGGTTPMQWSNTSLSSTKTIRKYDTANLATSVTGTTMYILGGSSSSNVIVTDGWTDATTRVTDGSVKSVFRITGTSPTFHFESSAVTAPVANNSFNMGNSYVVPGASTSSSGTINFRGRDSTYNISQFAVYSTGTSTVTFGSATIFSSNNNITIKNINNYYSLFGSLYGDSNVINIKNFYAYYPDAMFGILGAPVFASNTTVNFTDYVYAASNYNGAYLSLLGVQHPKLVVNNSTATWDIVANSGPGNNVYGMSGELTFRPPTTVYSNRRATLNPAKPGVRLYFYGNVAGPQKLSIDTANISLGVVTSVAMSSNYPPFAIAVSTGTTYIADIKKPMMINVEFATQANSANMVGTIAPTPVNILQTYRDGSWDPIEILGIKSNYAAANILTSNFPNVFRDTLTVRTTGPSFRSYLATRTAAYWINPSAPAGGTGEKSASYKNIKVPIISGSNYTITGYIRSNYASSTTGDVIMSVIYNNTVLATQNMTSAMYNSWEQFTLSFTASATGEAYLVWEMYYPSGTMSYWLDDLSIVKA